MKESFVPCPTVCNSTLLLLRIGDRYCCCSRFCACFVGLANLPPSSPRHLSFSIFIKVSCFPSPRSAYQPTHLPTPYRRTYPHHTTRVSRSRQCGDALHDHEYSSHIDGCRGTGGKSAARPKCPLCHIAITDDKEGWIDHLVTRGCPANPRTP